MLKMLIFRKQEINKNWLQPGKKPTVTHYYGFDIYSEGISQNCIDLIKKYIDFLFINNISCLIPFEFYTIWKYVQKNKCLI